MFAEYEQCRSVWLYQMAGERRNQNVALESNEASQRIQERRKARKAAKKARKKNRR
jgi:hypothetical protein